MGWFSDTFHANQAQRNRQGREDRLRENAAAPNPYDQGGQLQWDETGRPVIGGQPIRRPGPDFALDYQYLAEQEAERRRLGLWSDAQNRLRQGLDLFQSYRPGGSAALASGMFGQSASLYGTQALNTAAPDMLAGYRDQQLKRAEREREKAFEFQKLTGLAQTITNPMGLFAQPGQVPQGTQTTPQPVAGEPATPGQVPAPGATVGAPGGGGAMPYGGGGPGGAMLDSGGMNLAGDRGAYGSQLGPEGGGAGSRVRGAGGGGVGVDGSFGAGGSPGGPVGGGSRARAAGGGPGGGGGMGGSPPIQTYTGPEVSTRAQMGSPGASDIATSSWAADPSRASSVNLIASSARAELLDAAGLSGGAAAGSAAGAAGGASYSSLLLAL